MREAPIRGQPYRRFDPLKRKEGRRTGTHTAAALSSIVNDTGGKVK